MATTDEKDKAKEAPAAAKGATETKKATEGMATNPTTGDVVTTGAASTPDEPLGLKMTEQVIEGRRTADRDAAAATQLGHVVEETPESQDVSGRPPSGFEHLPLEQRVDLHAQGVAHTGTQHVPGIGMPPFPAGNTLIPTGADFSGGPDEGAEDKEDWVPLKYAGRQWGTHPGEQISQIGPESGRTYQFRHGVHTLVHPSDVGYFMEHEVLKFEEGKPDELPV